MFLFVVVLRIALLAALPITTLAQSGPPLSIREAQRLAEQNAPLVAAADAQAQAANELAVAAAQLPDPVLKLGLNNLPVDGPDRFSVTRDFMTMRSIGVMQEFPRHEKRNTRVERERRDAELAKAEGELARAAARRDVTLAWLDRFYQEALRELWREQLDETQLQIEVADTAYRGGKGSQADLFAARSQVEIVQDRISQVERQVQSANTRLARWVPEASSRRLGEKPNLDEIPLHATQVLTQLEQHPQLVVWDRQIALAEAEAKVAGANRGGDWSAELMYSQRGPAYSNMISINVSIPLQWDRMQRQDRETAAKLARVEQVRAQREDALRAHFAEVTTMLQEWENARVRERRYHESLVPLSKEKTLATITAYRSGAGAFTSVLEARRGEIDIRLELLRLEMDAAKVWAELTYFAPAEHRGAP
jgi:outer membrane protein TolC